MIESGAIAGFAAAAAVVLAGARWHRRSGRALPVRIAPPAARVDRRLRAVAAAVVGVGILVAVGPEAAFVVGGAAIGSIAMRRRSAARAARLAIETSMPDAIELIVMCLHAGLTPPQAVGELARVAPAPVRPGFHAMELRLHRGAGFADSLAALSRHCGRSALPLVSALGTAVRDGLPLAPVLDRLGDEANAARRRSGEVAARRLPVRLSFPLVVCTLPSFVLLAIAPAVLGALSTVRGSAP
jgi:tight adherence protein C